MHRLCEHKCNASLVSERTMLTLLLGHPERRKRVLSREHHPLAHACAPFVS